MVLSFFGATVSRALRGRYRRTGYLGAPTLRAPSIFFVFGGLGALLDLDFHSARCCLTRKMKQNSNHSKSISRRTNRAEFKRYVQLSNSGAKAMHQYYNPGLSEPPTIKTVSKMANIFRLSKYKTYFDLTLILRIGIRF